MKKNPFKVISLLATLILIAIVANWFLHFSAQVNNLIKVSMFIVIGIAFMIYSYALSNKLNKSIVFLCGVYLIVMNFLPDNEVFSIISIICLVVPMLIGRFSREMREIPSEDEE